MLRKKLISFGKKCTKVKQKKIKMYNFVENLQKIEYYGIIVRAKKLILV